MRGKQLIEVLNLNAASHSLQMLGKGSEKSGSSVTMNLTAHIETNETLESSTLVGHATITVNGKLAQFGGRLLEPVSDVLLAQFADNFRAAAVAVQTPGSTAEAAKEDAKTTAAVLPTVKELTVPGLLWTMLKSWLSRLFGMRA